MAKSKKPNKKKPPSFGRPSKKKVDKVEEELDDVRPANPDIDHFTDELDEEDLDPTHTT